METSQKAEITPPPQPIIAVTTPTSVFPGFRFSLTDQELIQFYLRRKIEGSLDKSVEIISVLDIFKHEPWELPGFDQLNPSAKSIIESDFKWFFFSPRVKKYPNVSQSPIRRVTKTGYWKTTGKEREVKSGSEVIGTKRKLVFHVDRAVKGSRTEWIMHEYYMSGRSSTQDSLVVCRLRKKNELTLNTEGSFGTTSRGCDVSSSGSELPTDRSVDRDLIRERFKSEEVKQGTSSTLPDDGEEMEMKGIYALSSLNLFDDI